MLADLNVIGHRIGYPFYVYADGHYGKTVIAADKERHAVMAVKRPFLEEELQSPDTEDSALSGVRQLSAIGAKTGYPLYVYANGCCGTQPKDAEKGFLFSLKLTAPVEADDVVEETMTSLVREVMNRDKSLNENELETFLKFAEPEEVRQWIIAGNWCVGAVKLLYQYGFIGELKGILRKRCLSVNEEVALLQLGDVELIWLYFQFSELADKAECLFIKNGMPLLVKAYIRLYSLDISAQFALIQRGDVELMDFFAQRRTLSVFVEKTLIETQNDALILAYVSQRRLSEEGEELLVRLDNRALVQGYVAAHQTFVAFDALVYAQKHQLL